MAFQTLGDITVHHRRSGDATAPTLVFVNSLGTDLRVWDRVADRLDGRFRLVRYDKRGHGLTDLTAGPYTIPALADDLARLLDFSEVRAAVVCGLSIGGMIALALAARRPDLVRGLVLTGTAHKIGTAESWQRRIDAVRGGGIEAIADDVLARWFAPAFRARRRDELAGWRNMLTRTPVDGYLGCCAAIRDADLTGEATALRVPATCLVGEHDGATPPESVEAFARLVRGADCRVLPEAGHLPCAEQPGLVASIIERFAEGARMTGGPRPA